ncbi:metabotropic glutamate receptor 5-like [Haliotis rubra]|uniref:metabotropic glutamate receptor 5-like n=1 Tax=Haliotis rubra TaxID=36100 RepID=UPI001EE51D85|nr:metabotropic glutamate receptor 5-like [Haliotis rubra]
MTKYMDRQRPHLLGILGPEYSSETKEVSRLLSSLPEEDRLLQISYSATAAFLSDKSIYKNLYRVIETDDVQVEVTLKLMQALNWNYVSIVFDSDTYGRDAAYALRVSAEAEDICIPVFLSLDLGQTKSQQEAVFSNLTQRLQKYEESPVLGLVFFGRAETAKDMFVYLDKHLKLTNFQMIVSESLAVDKMYVQDAKDGQIIPRTKGLLTQSPDYYDVESFSQFWADLHKHITLITKHIRNNDWFHGYLQKITGCQFKDSMVNATACLNNASEYIRGHTKLNLYTHYALRGAAAFAKTVKQLYTEWGSNTDVCFPLRSQAISKMEQIVVSTRGDFKQEFPNVNITFSFEKGEIRYAKKEEPDYTVFNFKSNGSSFGFYKVGEFRDDRLNITDTIVAFNKDEEETDAVHAQCQKSYDCIKCLKSNEDAKVLYIPGDFYIIGMAPIHNKGGTFLKCGSVRAISLSVDLTIALQFAVSTLNNKSGIFGGTLGNKTIGLVVLDTCSNPYKIQEQIISLNDGSLRLDHSSNSSKILDKIIGYIGPAFSFVTVPVSTLLTQTKTLQISYSATASTLSNRGYHPYFMRASSPDPKQAEVIMQLAKRTSSKYIQIIFSKEEYGIDGKEALLDAAQKEEICVAQTVEAENTDDPSKHTGYISKLRRYRYAKVVVVFALPFLTRLIMQNLDKDMESREFSFIGGESWAQMEDLLTTNLRGSITIAQKLPEITAFAEYFKNIDIQTYENPWLQEYFEEIKQCYVPKSFQRRMDKKCPSSRLGDSIKPDLWIL